MKANSLDEKLLAKFPNANVFEGIVTTETEKMYYCLDAAGRLRCTHKRLLTPTEISVNKLPINCVIMLTSEGPYNGTYYTGISNREVSTTLNKEDAHKMNSYVANEVINILRTHAMACYGNSFTIVTT